VVLGNLR